MQYRQLGRSGLRVSALTFGSVTFGGEGAFAATGNIDETGARRMIDLCIEHGVNMFDTANAYSDGLAERILGQAIKGRSEEILVTSKARFPMGKGQNDAGLSRHNLINACEASLKRLGRDHLDLYYMHEWDGQTPPEETLEALTQLRRDGKIRYVGVSNFSGWHVMKMLSASEREGLIAPVSEQIYYSLESRDAEYELLPLAVDQGLGVQVWSPLACGLLSGKYRRGKSSPEEGRQIQGWSEPEVRDLEKLYDTVEVLIEIGEAHGVTAARVALAWLLSKAPVTSVVIGARKESQLLDNLASVDLHLKQGEIARLDEVSAPALIYPYWHQNRTASDRFSEADLVLHGPATKHRKALAKKD